MSHEADSPLHPQLAAGGPPPYSGEDLGVIPPRVGEGVRYSALCAPLREQNRVGLKRRTAVVIKATGVSSPKSTRHAELVSAFKWS